MLYITDMNVHEILGCTQFSIMRFEAFTRTLIGLILGVENVLNHKFIFLGVRGIKTFLIKKLSNY